MSLFEWLTITLGCLTAFAGLGSVIFVGVQVRQAAIASREATAAAEVERTRQRKRETMQAIAATTRYRQSLKAGLPWNDRDADIVKMFLEKAEANDEAKLSVRAYLDYLEMLAAGANENVLDIGLLTRITGSRIVAVATNYSPYIQRRRKELGSSSLYGELESLARAIARGDQSH